MFKSKKQLKAYIKKAQFKGRKRRLSAYKCEHCDHWHYTSMDAESLTGIRESKH